MGPCDDRSERRPRSELDEMRRLSLNRMIDRIGEQYGSCDVCGPVVCVHQFAVVELPAVQCGKYWENWQLVGALCSYRGKFRHHGRHQPRMKSVRYVQPTH